MEPKSRQEGILKSPVLSLWLPWSYFSRLLRSCIGTVGLFLLPRPHRAHVTAFITNPFYKGQFFIGCATATAPTAPSYLLHSLQPRFITGHFKGAVHALSAISA